MTATHIRAEIQRQLDDMLIEAEEIVQHYRVNFQESESARVAFARDYGSRIRERANEVILAEVELDSRAMEASLGAVRESGAESASCGQHLINIGKYAATAIFGAIFTEQFRRYLVQGRYKTAAKLLCKSSLLGSVCGVVQKQVAVLLRKFCTRNCWYHCSVGLYIIGVQTLVIVGAYFVGCPVAVEDGFTGLCNFFRQNTNILLLRYMECALIYTMSAMIPTYIAMGVSALLINYLKCCKERRDSGQSWFESLKGGLIDIGRDFYMTGSGVVTFIRKMAVLDVTDAAILESLRDTPEDDPVREQIVNLEPDPIRRGFTCSLSFGNELVRDPVFLKGNLYERSQITRWIQQPRPVRDGQAIPPHDPLDTKTVISLLDIVEVPPHYRKLLNSYVEMRLQYAI